MDAVVKEIRKIYLTEAKNGNTVIIIQHSLIPLYNPVTKKYRKWEVEKPSEWIIHIGRGGVPLYSMQIVAMYDSIESIMNYLVNGNV
jgi:hypothetical protein